VFLLLHAYNIIPLKKTIKFKSTAIQNSWYWNCEF
jgi:hypothetical protein